MSHPYGAFKGKRVLVTGNTGFKGSWLSLWLSELGAKVTGFALPAEDPSLFKQLQLEQIVEHVNGDIRDAEHVLRVFKETEPEILFHLAAQSLVQRSYLEPKLTFDTNLGGSVNVLEAARSCKSLKAIIFVTSDKCYLNKNWVWGYRETDELGGTDPYSASKAAAEIAFAAYSESFLGHGSSIGAASVRAGNVIGGGDYSLNRILPDCVRALAANKPIVLRNPHSTRPWQHVLDPLRGYLELALALLEEPTTYSGSWNFGPTDSAIRTVDEVAREVVREWGSGEVTAAPAKDAYPEAQLLHLNCDKAHAILGWRPRWNFNECITRTVAWYRETHAGKDPLKLSQLQIRAHMEAAND